MKGREEQGIYNNFLKVLKSKSENVMIYLVRVVANVKQIYANFFSP